MSDEVLLSLPVLHAACSSSVAYSDGNPGTFESNGHILTAFLAREDVHNQSARPTHQSHDILAYQPRAMFYPLSSQLEASHNHLLILSQAKLLSSCVASRES